MPDSNVSKFDLSLEAVPNNDETLLTFEYATSLFSKEFIDGLSKHYLNIISNVLDNVDIKISDIDMLFKDEKYKILYDFNSTLQKIPNNKTISELFEAQVEKTPNNTAIVVNNTHLTYAELNCKANSLAYFLRDTVEIMPNDLVGIMVNRSPEMIIAILAVLKAGGAYIPIDPTYPDERISYMLDSSHAKVLLTQKTLSQKLEYKNTIFIDLDNSDIYNKPADNLKQISTAKNLGYIIFTSGSTGKPKGVMVNQYNILNFIYGMIKEFNFTNQNTIASLTTISFDIFVLESLMPLLNGLKVVIANEEEQTNIELFNKLCTNNNVEIIQSTPSRIEAFLADTENLDCIKNATYLLIGGEAISSSLLNSLKKVTSARIYNMYGPTETTVWSSLKDLTNTDIITIGHPIINTQIYILDNNLRPVPIGVTGEIYISGDGVTNGYLNNKDLTNKNFISNPFVLDRLMYKTGDMGLYLNSGDIVCLGRLDNQIKIRGLRIDLEEVESVIEQYNGVKKAIVIKQTLDARDFLSAYYIADSQINTNELKIYLSKFLPKYMIPGYYTEIDNIPYTPNGKVDKKALPLPKNMLNISTQSYVAPKTDIQKQIAKIWKKLLKRKDFGINDNFFELGGDSLLAMNLNVELRKLSTNISYQDIFRFPTILELEERMNSTDSDKQYFSKIQDLSGEFEDILKQNTILKKAKRCHPKGVLLTGSTGFLGIHVLEQLIKHEKCNVYCIVRDSKTETSKSRLHDKLNYYFGKKYDDLIDKRIFTVTGDITIPGFGLNQDDSLHIINSVDTIVNCAANVFHFGNYNAFYNSNVKSVKYIIDFCRSFNKKLYHVSTISVADTKLELSYLLAENKQTVEFDESCLYIGQPLNNVYTRTKFEAEVQVLSAINKGLDAYILRMGHLMPRFKDGVFQPNILENDFINKSITFIRLGFMPDYLASYPCDFTPVDQAANAIYKLISRPNNTNRIFHLYNSKYVLVSKLLKLMQKQGYEIKILSEADFKNKIQNILNDEKNKYLIKNILNDFDNDLHLTYESDILLKADFTNKYLKKLHFKWSTINNKYLRRFIDLLRKEI